MLIAEISEKAKPQISYKLISTLVFRPRPHAEQSGSQTNLLILAPVTQMLPQRAPDLLTPGLSSSGEREQTSYVLFYAAMAITGRVLLLAVIAFAPLT
jgi:hypothetical protein